MCWGPPDPTRTFSALREYRSIKVTPPPWVQGTNLNPRYNIDLEVPPRHSDMRCYKQTSRRSELLTHRDRAPAPSANNHLPSTRASCIAMQPAMVCSRAVQTHV